MHLRDFRSFLRGTSKTPLTLSRVRLLRYWSFNALLPWHPISERQQMHTQLHPTIITGNLLLSGLWFAFSNNHRSQLFIIVYVDLNTDLNTIPTDCPICSLNKWTLQGCLTQNSENRKAAINRFWDTACSIDGIFPVSHILHQLNILTKSFNKIFYHLTRISRDGFMKGLGVSMDTPSLKKHLTSYFKACAKIK